MSWRISTSVIGDGDASASHWTQVFSPGAIVPVSGIYRCRGCKKEVTSNSGDPFPPQNHHQHPDKTPIQWKLNVRTNTEGS